MLFIGVDPGAGGGIAAIDYEGVVGFVTRMPDTERDLLDVFIHLSTMPGAALYPGPPHALLERVHTSPQMGVKSAGTFMQGYGALRMGLTAARIPFDDVTPQAWQKSLGVLQRGVEFGKKDKNLTKRKAQALFPGEKVTHAIADALLIAEFCRRVRTSGPGELTITGDTSLQLPKGTHGKKGKGSKTARVSEF